MPVVGAAELLVAQFDPDYSSVWPSWWLWLAVGVAVSFLVYTWIYAALIDDLRSSARGVWSSYGRTARLLPMLVPAVVVTGVPILLGLLALVIPGLLLLARWSLVLPLIVIDGETVVGAIQRSNASIRGRTWPVARGLGLLLLISGGAYLLGLAIAELALDNVIGAWLLGLLYSTPSVLLFAYSAVVLHRRFATDTATL